MNGELGNASLASNMRLVAQADCERYAAPSSSKTRHGQNYFRSAEWSPDGTCIIANAADNCIRTFIVPPELLEQRDQPLRLSPYSSITSQESADALVCYPGYSLEDVSSALLLSAVNEHPIRLSSALTGKLVASYRLVNANTEAFIKPQSMLFTADGGRFIAGGQSMIAIFDVSRPSSEPLSLIKTGPTRSGASWSNPSLAMRGLISALAIDAQYNVLAAGTLSRQIGLYDSAGQGECISVFSVAGTEADKAVSGNGVTQLAWSRCGRYLFVTERKSDGIIVYDIRKSGQLLSWAAGRAAVTNQRMRVELYSTADNEVCSLWAGGQDGRLRRWNDVHLQQGAVTPMQGSQLHQNVVNSVSMHATARVLVTADGHRERYDIGEWTAAYETESPNAHSSFKIWDITVPASEGALT